LSSRREILGACPGRPHPKRVRGVHVSSQDRNFRPARQPARVLGPRSSRTACRRRLGERQTSKREFVARAGSHPRGPRSLQVSSNLGFPFPKMRPGQTAWKHWKSGFGRRYGAVVVAGQCPSSSQKKVSKPQVFPVADFGVTCRRGFRQGRHDPQGRGPPGPWGQPPPRGKASWRVVGK